MHAFTHASDGPAQPLPPCAPSSALRLARALLHDSAQYGCRRIQHAAPDAWLFDADVFEVPGGQVVSADNELIEYTELSLYRVIERRGGMFEVGWLFGFTPQEAKRARFHAQYLRQLAAGLHGPVRPLQRAPENFKLPCTFAVEPGAAPDPLVPVQFVTGWAFQPDAAGMVELRMLALGPSQGRAALPGGHARVRWLRGPVNLCVPGPTT